MHPFQGCIKKLTKGSGGGAPTESYKMKRERNPSHMCKFRLMIWKARMVWGHATPAKFDEF